MPRVCRDWTNRYVGRYAISHANITNNTRAVVRRAPSSSGPCGSTCREHAGRSFARLSAVTVLEAAQRAARMSRLDESIRRSVRDKSCRWVTRVLELEWVTMVAVCLVCAEHIDSQLPIPRFECTLDRSVRAARIHLFERLRASTAAWREGCLRLETATHMGEHLRDGDHLVVVGKAILRGPAFAPRFPVRAPLIVVQEIPRLRVPGILFEWCEVHRPVVLDLGHHLCEFR